MNIETTKPFEAAEITAGMRVRWDHGKWTRDASRGGQLLLDPEWQSRSWFFRREGTTQPRGIAREWGLFDVPATATVVWWDGESRPTWTNSASLEVIGFAAAAPAPDGIQQLELQW